MLSHLERHNKLIFKEVNLRLRSRGVYSSLKNILYVFETAKKLKPDLILLEAPGLFTIIAILLQKIYKIPIVCRFKGDIWKVYSDMKYDMPLKEKVARYLNYRAGIILLRHSDAILPISNHIANVLNQNLKQRNPLYVVNIPYLKLDRPDKSEICNVEGEFILTVTNFNFWDKIEPLVDKINMLSNILIENEIVWVILGDGLFMDKFRMELTEEKAFDAVRLPGWKNPYSFYKKALAMFYISGMDGLPNVLLESFYYKLPVIIDAECPAAEFVQQNNNGIIVDFTDLKYVRNLIRSLNEDNHFRTISETAHEYVVKQFSVENVSKQLEKALYNIMLDTKQND